MSVSSISRAETDATAHATACCCIRGNSASLFFSVSFFESFRPGRSNRSGRMTAAA